MTKKKPVACAKVVPQAYHRQTSNRRKKPKAASAVDYPPGFFSELVRQHRWPPRFEPSMQRDVDRSPKLGRPTSHGGWAGGTIALPNTPTQPVPAWMPRRPRQ